MQCVMRRLSSIMLVLFVATCAGAGTPQLQASPPPQADPTTRAEAPTPTRDIASPAVTTVPADASPAAPADIASARAEFNGIPQGITSEGFYRLGDPDALVTLIDYSDFL